MLSNLALFLILALALAYTVIYIRRSLKARDCNCEDDKRCPSGHDPSACAGCPYFRPPGGKTPL
jgi:hypothetical protein